MSAVVIPFEAALVARRDRRDPGSEDWVALDHQLYNSLLRQACEVDLRGLEVWWGNGGYRDGQVVAVEESDEDGPLLVLDTLETDADEEEGKRNARHSLWEVLAAGWLQEPGDEDDDPDSDGYALTIRALARRRRQ